MKWPSGPWSDCTYNRESKLHLRDAKRPQVPFEMVGENLGVSINVSLQQLHVSTCRVPGP